MKIAIFSAQTFEKPFLEKANQQHQHHLDFFDACLTEQTARLATDYGHC